MDNEPGFKARRRHGAATFWWKQLHHHLAGVALGAAAAQTLQLVDGWLPPGNGRGQGPAPCRWSPAPPIAAPGPDALTQRHRHLMMIDRVVFFITLNPISTRCNLSNDGSLFATAELKGFFILAQWRSPWDEIKRSMPFLSYAYSLLIWKSYFSCEIQIKRKSV